MRRDYYMYMSDSLELHTNWEYDTDSDKTLTYIGDTIKLVHETKERIITVSYVEDKSTAFLIEVYIDSFNPTESIWLSSTEYPTETIAKSESFAQAEEWMDSYQ